MEEDYMNVKTRVSMLILAFILFSGCSAKKLSGAQFTNTTPAEIKMKNSTYMLTDEILSSNEVKKQIGKITHVNALVSYLEEDNPYKNPSKILEVKNIEIEEAIAVQVNDKLYKAKNVKKH